MIMNYKKIVANVFAHVSAYPGTRFTLITYKERGIDINDSRIDLCANHEEQFANTTKDDLCKYYETKFANLTLNESRDILYLLTPYLDRLYWEYRTIAAAQVIIALQYIENQIINDKLDRLSEKVERLENKE